MDKGRRFCEGIISIKTLYGNEVGLDLPSKLVSVIMFLVQTSSETLGRRGMVIFFHHLINLDPTSTCPCRKEKSTQKMDHLQASGQAKGGFVSFPSPRVTVLGTSSHWSDSILLLLDMTMTSIRQTSRLLFYCDNCSLLIAILLSTVLAGPMSGSDSVDQS